MIVPIYDKAMFRGLFGEFALALCGDQFLGGSNAPNTESSPAAILFQTMSAAGAYFGKNVSHAIDSSQHYPAFFTLIVGKTSKARKGTSYSHIRKLFNFVDQDWAENSIIGGLSSGEGLINRFTEPIDDSSSVRIEQKNCRLLVTEFEFARVLQMNRRDGNILSQVLRDGWDTTPLHVLTRSAPLRAKDYHFGLIGHITLQEFKQSTGQVDATNGFLNRFLMVYADRQCKLPISPEIDDSVYQYFAKQIKIIADTCKNGQQIKFSKEAIEYWTYLYDLFDASEDEPHLDAILARGEAHTRRLAMMYCLAEGKFEISKEHLESAYLAWSYCIQSARFIFTATMDDIEKVLALLREFNRVDKTTLHKALGNHFSGKRLEMCLLALKARNHIVFETESTLGRPRDIIQLLVATN